MDRLAEVAGQVGSSASRLKKLAALSAYFPTLSDEDLPRAVRFLSGSPFAASDTRKLSVGGATLNAALVAASGADPETMGHAYRESGDAGAAAAAVLEGRTGNQPFTLAEADDVFHRLQTTRKAEDKTAILEEVFRTRRPPAIRYFVKIITGELRIGLQQKLVGEAIAAAFHVPAIEVREANNRCGDLGRVAIAARQGTLGEIEVALFHPMDFMLAKPLDSLDDLADPGNWIVEDKYDGIRAQVHVAGGKVRIFTRGLQETTAAFPDVVSAMASLEGSVVLDGEILAWKDGRALPFNALQQRIARKKVSAALIEQVPAAFLGYDVLCRDGELLLKVPIEERRRILESTGIALVAPQFSAATHEEIDRLFSEAQQRGNEGLVLKRRGSLYEAASRSGTWQKVKRTLASLDVVVTAAERGHGRRAQVLSDYTFAVRAGDQLLNVGKAYSGLTDAEILELTELFKTLTVQRYGGTHIVRPEVVLEVTFNGIQESRRHKSGYALRFPRILRWRHDKKPDEIDTLERVKELYEATLQPSGTASREDEPA